MLCFFFLQVRQVQHKGVRQRRSLRPSEGNWPGAGEHARGARRGAGELRICRASVTWLLSDSDQGRLIWKTNQWWGRSHTVDLFQQPSFPGGLLSSPNKQRNPLHARARRGTRSRSRGIERTLRIQFRTRLLNSSPIDVTRHRSSLLVSRFPLAATQR